MKKAARKFAILDVETWLGSTYSMVHRLIALRPHITRLAELGNDELTLSPAEWKQAVDL